MIALAITTKRAKRAPIINNYLNLFINLTRVRTHAHVYFLEYVFKLTRVRADQFNDLG